jgi:hypothetical protein
MLRAYRRAVDVHRVRARSRRAENSRAAVGIAVKAPHRRAAENHTSPARRWLDRSRPAARARRAGRARRRAVGIVPGAADIPAARGTDKAPAVGLAVLRPDAPASAAARLPRGQGCRRAGAGRRYSRDANNARAFPDGARVEALHLGFAPPRLALGKHVAAAATRQHAEDAKTDGADEIPTSSPRHGGNNAWDFVNDSSKIPPRWMPLVRASRYG